MSFRARHIEKFVAQLKIRQKASFHAREPPYRPRTSRWRGHDGGTGARLMILSIYPA